MSDDDRRLVPDPDQGTEPPGAATPTGSGEETADAEHEPSPPTGWALGGGVARGRSAGGRHERLPSGRYDSFARFRSGS